jgi:hypothetical protein
VTLDAIAGERQFADHLAPVWRALPSSIRGRFLAETPIVDHVRSLGIDAVPLQRPAPLPTYPPPRFNGTPALVASYGDIKMARRLGYGPFVFMEHGAGQSYDGDRRSVQRSGSYAGGPDREDNELILVPNARCAERWRETYPGSRVEIIGNPMLDALPTRQPGPGPVVAISFHWPTPNALGPEAGTAVGEYLPILPELAKRYTVIGHAHPKGDWPKTMRRYYERAGIPFVADFADVCRQADVYVCDNSSTLFEFAATGRPVVVLNSKHYRRDIEHGLRFWEAADVGMQVDKPGDLIETIQAALNDPPDAREAREAALDIVYPVRSGGAALAAAAIGEWLDARRELAA